MSLCWVSDGERRLGWGMERGVHWSTSHLPAMNLKSMLSRVGQRERWGRERERS